MGYDKNRLNTGLLALRVESGRLLTPASVAAEIENFEVTVEGTLHSIAGPAPVLPQYTPMAGYFNYGRTHGIYHGLLMEGSRDVLLVHSEDSIRVFKGWSRTWETLIGPSGSGAQIEVDLIDTDVPQAPTQFTQTPTGIIIVPQNRARAYFYDGEVVLPLGYDRVPSAPIGFGPTSTFDPTDVTNNLINVFGFMGSGSTTSPPSYASSDDFGLPQVGTIIPDATGTQLGVLGASRYQAAVQWVDYFGNLSPVSPRSNIVSIDSQNLPLDAGGGDTRTPDQWLRAFLWTAISIGPQGTIGRVFCHTKDMVNSGTSALFEVAGNMMGATSGSYATFPDNTTNVYQYNRPDSELITSPPQPIPVPIFRLCAVAFGRLWIAGIEGNPTAVIPSMPGRWGTFLRDSEYFPDPTGGAITALFPIREGLLVFTATSTFIMVASDDGQSFRAMPLSNTVGCVAPSSLVTLQDESTIWLGRDGFYQFETDKGVHSLSLEIEDMVKRINPVRAKQACAVLDPRSHEYRCWVPLDGGRENDFCFVFDPVSQGWRRRTGTEFPTAVCLTKDHRQYILMAGRVTDNTLTKRWGVWLMDHTVASFTPKPRTYRLETSWIEAGRSKDVKSGKMVYLWLRESANASATITVYRDWRKTKAVYADSTNADLIDPEDVPPLWGTTVYGQASTPNQWIKRRPYWKKVSIFVPSCEVYKVELSSTAPIEIVGLSMDELPQGGSARVP